jgi:hypothetical protein
MVTRASLFSVRNQAVFEKSGRRKNNHFCAPLGKWRKATLSTPIVPKKKVALRAG